MGDENKEKAESEILDNFNDWQTPKKKAKKRAFEQADSPVKLNKGNRFSCLRDENPDREENNVQKKNPPPPPLFIHDVTKLPAMVKKIATILGKQDFITKTLNHNTVKVNTQTPEDYRKLVSTFKQEDVNYHTYQPKLERSYRVVIRHLHPSFTEDEINYIVADKISTLKKSYK